jgi:flagellar FliL protein
MSDDAEGAADAVPPKSGNKILPILLVVNTLLVTGVLVFVMKRPSAQAASGKGEHAEKAEKSEHGEKAEKSEHGEKGEGKGEHGGEGEHDSDAPGPSVHLDAFIVQVRSAEGDRYVHINFDIEAGSEGDKKAMEARMARIRDAIIGYLSDRTEDELRGSEGLAQVKAAVTKKIEELVPGRRVKGLFTTEFIIQ